MRLRQLKQAYPFIEWTEPIVVTLIDDPGVKHYACRICIAEQGLRGNQVKSLPTDPEVVRQHIKEAHGTHSGNPE